MATLRQRNGKWQAQVRRYGHVPRTKSFLSKRDAERWARQTEAQLDATAISIDPRELERTTIRDLLDRYRRDVTVAKRGAASENSKRRLDSTLISA